MKVNREDLQDLLPGRIILLISILLLVVPGTAQAWHDSYDYGVEITPASGTLSTPVNFTWIDPNITLDDAPFSRDGYASQQYDYGWCATCNTSTSENCKYGTSGFESTVDRVWADGEAGIDGAWEGYTACDCNSANTWGKVDMGAQVSIEEVHVYGWDDRNAQYEIQVSPNDSDWTSIGTISQANYDNYELGNFTGHPDRLMRDLIFNTTMTARYIRVHVSDTAFASCDFSMQAMWVKLRTNDTMWTFEEHDSLLINTTAGNLTIEGYNFTAADPATHINSTDQRCIIPQLDSGTFYIFYNETCTLIDISGYTPWDNGDSATLSSVGSEETAPGITLNTPTNTTYTTEPINATWTNTSDYDTVWYSLNAGADTNVTTYFDVYPAVGSNYLIVYMNDTNGIEYNDSISFSFTPTVNITFTSPSNASYQAPPSMHVNYSYVSPRPCSSALYSIDGAANVSGSCVNFSIDISSLSSGLHNITLHVTNNESYADAESVWFNTQQAIVNCSDAGAVESLRFDFYVEDTLAVLNGSAEFVITDISSDYTYNISVINTTNFSVCIVDAPRVVDMMMLYRSSGYEQRTYYLYHADLTATRQDIPLYQITTALGEKVEINTRDNNDNDVESVYVAIDRYYPATDSYNTIAIGRSANTGKFITYLDLDDVFYRFTLSQAGTAVNTYAAMTITDTDDDPETMVLYIGALETQFFEMISDIGITCYFNETTNNTICSVTDPTGLIVTATLYVQEIGLAGASTICTDTGSGTSFTLSCNIPTPDGEYKYFVKVTPGSNPDYVLYQDFIYTTTTNPYGIIGLFISFLFILAMAGIGIYIHEMMGIILGVTFAALVIAGVLTLPWVAVTSIVIMGVILLFGDKKR